ncbi:MAG: Lrp/AsnC family transcriptional regulator [Ruminococcaceae bacterium]|nr:Lrp/AsnC family transcriptional regulator [Oscillospiraceae bacterium]
MKKLLKLLEKDAHVTPAELALMCEKETGDIKQMIHDYEKQGVILGYTTVIDWDKTDFEYVNALIELKVTPRVGSGYDEIAERIYNYPEVESVYLMSGGYDLTVMLRGKTMREVAIFVAAKLATIEAVTSTATHFVLRKYKDHNVIFGGAPVDERGNIL